MPFSSISRGGRSSGPRRTRPPGPSAAGRHASLRCAVGGVQIVSQLVEMCDVASPRFVLPTSSEGNGSGGAWAEHNSINHLRTSQGAFGCATRGGWVSPRDAPGRRSIPISPTASTLRVAPVFRFCWVVHEWRSITAGGREPSPRPPSSGPDSTRPLALPDHAASIPQDSETPIPRRRRLRGPRHPGRLSWSAARPSPGSGAPRRVARGNSVRRRDRAAGDWFCRTRTDRPPERRRAGRLGARPQPSGPGGPPPPGGGGRACSPSGEPERSDDGCRRMAVLPLRPAGRRWAHDGRSGRLAGGAVVRQTRPAGSGPPCRRSNCARPRTSNGRTISFNMRSNRSTSPSRAGRC